MTSWGMAPWIQNAKLLHGYAGLTLIFDGELLLGIAQLEERTCSAAWKWICDHCEQPEHTVSFLNDLRRQLQAQKQQQGQSVGDYWTGNHTKWLQYLSLNGEMTAGVFRDNNQDGLLPELHPILAAIGLPKTCSLADYRAAIFLAEDRLKMQKAALGTPSTGSCSTPPASTSDTVDHSGVAYATRPKLNLLCKHCKRPGHVETPPVRRWGPKLVWGRGPTPAKPAGPGDGAGPGGGSTEIFKTCRAYCRQQPVVAAAGPAPVRDDYNTSGPFTTIQADKVAFPAPGEGGTVDVLGLLPPSVAAVYASEETLVRL
eukprot:jgi/Mesvir1/20386/Mv12291-RA.1